MRIPTLRELSLKLITSIFLGSSVLPLYATLNTDVLENQKKAGSSSYSGDSKAFNAAITFSLLQPLSRVKVVGPYRPYLETGFQGTDVDDKRLFPYTSNLHSPSVFQSLFGKVGLGLPFGLTAELGISQVISEHKLNGAFVTLGGQVFDFSTIVYTDFVPTMTVSGTLLRTLFGPPLYALHAQAVIGGYHRIWFAQFAYFFQTNYTMRMAASDSNLFLRHGILMLMPLQENLYLRTEFSLPTMAGSLSMGYQF